MDYLKIKNNLFSKIVLNLNKFFHYKNLRSFYRQFTNVVGLLPNQWKWLENINKNVMDKMGQIKNKVKFGWVMGGIWQVLNWKG